MPHAAPLAWHGGQLAAAARLYPDASLPWLDLSTGIAPWAYPLDDIPDKLWQRLPEQDELAALEAAGAAGFGDRKSVV